MDTGNEYAQDLTVYDEATSFFDPHGTSEYYCRLGFNYTDDLDIDDDFEEGLKVFITKLGKTIQSDQVRCSVRNTLFDVYLKVISASPIVDRSTASSVKQRIVGSVHGRFFKHLVEELHLQRPMQLQLTINFDEPLNKTIITKTMTLISDPRDKLWPKAFKFEFESIDDPWIIPSSQTSVRYTIEAKILASPFVKSFGGLGFIHQYEDGETAQMNKRFLEKRAHCDFTLVSGNGENEIRCHKMFLAESSPFFERMLQGNMKEAKEKKCRLDGSTKQGLEALLKFFYYRGVEDALNSSIMAYELLDLGHKYDISRLEETMMGILLAKQSDWWDLELTVNLFLRTRNTELWKPLKNKAKEVLKMLEER
ncbi:Kelch-like protein 9 [Orchesella cincta]|uniref:Kelch-like protein 9 n=1 Tax=Orchesella cincta TaxID=48709 RepID=A0A1D2M7Z7_ORCCI|nr:Kelch-like protein 9 [Orchesella cincta]